MMFRLVASCFLISVIIASCDISQTKLAKAIGQGKNVYGEKMTICCTDPITGYYRDGNCRSGKDDIGVHIICAIVTDSFLDFSESRGNNLRQAIPNTSFQGLKSGDSWCLCIERWVEAYKAGFAPPVDLSASHIKTLNYVPLDTLEKFDINAKAFRNVKELQFE